MEEQTVEKRGGADWIDSWNKSRVNIQQVCSSLVIVLTSNRKLDKGGAERQGAAPGKKDIKKEEGEGRGYLGRKIPVQFVEVGIKNDVKQRLFLQRVWGREGGR